MITNILQDAETTKKLLEAILESSNGKRSLSRLARVCRALCEPALDVLWRELDSIVPILGLFPPSVLKKARRPGLGFARVPQEPDWDTILKYKERIRRVLYDETANNVAASVFSIIDEHRPCLYILPNLQELVWRVETPAGLDRCAMFLSPRLRSIQVEVGASFKQDKIRNFLYDMSSRTKLTSFSFNSPTSLPDSFTELLARQDELERVYLVAPGALSSGVGRWLASLPALKTLQLDLTGRSPVAVEGFFDEIDPRSGAATPSSIASSDSGFSSGEWDFTEFRKSALRVTGDLPSKDSFAQLRRVHLTGEAGNIAVYLKHLSSPLTHIDLNIEDPPDNADWQDLTHLICGSFGDSLQSLRIGATSSARFAESVRSATRGEAPSRRLTLEHLSDLIRLTRLEIDLPESIIFLPPDLDAIADACPKVEVLRLCPHSRFAPNTGGPKITLESLALLTRRCKYLTSISAVVNACEASPTTLKTQALSSKSLLRLYLGGSWISDPLQVAILLSHMAPRLESLRHFQERNRVGYNEANARSWQAVSGMLPHLQAVRETEKSFARPIPETTEKAVDATVQTISRAVQCRPRMSSISIQCSPKLVNRSVLATAKVSSIGVDATVLTAEVAVEAHPTMVSLEIDATEPVLEEEEPKVETMELEEEELKQAMSSQVLQQIYLLQSIVGFFSLFYTYVAAFPLAVPRMGRRAIEGLPLTILAQVSQPNFIESEPKIPAENDTPTATDINFLLDTAVQVDA
ncbi:hypothetical protein MD484_g1180, partial [Candolleomyces efflorescens]